MSETYKRSQMQLALWQAFVFLHGSRDSPSSTFRTRIKRLLDLDRHVAKLSKKKGHAAKPAFMEETPLGKGTDLAFTTFNVFCIGVGLELLDCGFKQGEVVFLLQHLQQDLAQQFTKILRRPPAPRQKILAKDTTKGPSYEENGVELADCRVFVLVQKVELTEVFPGRTKKRPKDDPLILHPHYCDGIKQLHEALHRMNYQYRKVLVMEIANLAVLVKDALERAPRITRGRP